MIDVTTVRLPTHFEKLDSLDKDSRFQKVRIFIAHTGENLNNSVFSHDVLESMIPSLAHIPILGYVGRNQDDEADFRGHEKKLTIDDSGFRVSFDTHAYGFIPTENDAHFEITGGREWLVADGYLWTRFVDAMELFDSSNGSKGQSMEVGNVDGYTDEFGRMVFTSATFTGLCILGDDVPPAMTGSTISMVFSQKDFKNTFEKMLAEFTAEKGEGTLATKKKIEDEPRVESEPKQPEDKKSSNSQSSATDKAPKSTDKTEKSDEKVSEDRAAHSENIESNDTSDNSEEHEEDVQMSADKKDSSLDKNESASDEGNKEEKKSFKKEDSDQDDKEEANDESDADDDEDKKNKQFELSLSEREQAFLSCVRAKYEENYNWIWLETVYEDHGIVQASVQEFGDTKYFDIKYSVNADDSIKLGEMVEVFPMFVTQQEKDKIESDRNKLVDLEKKIQELTNYKNDIEMQAKKDALINASDKLTSKQVKDIKAQFEVKSTTEIEKEIAYAIYTTNKDAITSSRHGVRTTNFEAKQDYGYGSANGLFHK